MSDVVIEVDGLWKKYRLGVLGTGTLRHDFNRWLHRLAGRPDPYAKVGEIEKAESRKQKAENASEFQLSTFPISALSADELWALRDISFEVKQGEILGIIGRNGAGKSTLLKILSRVTAPTAGEVRVKGRIASLLEVGTGFHPELTGRENIFLNGAILGMSKAEIKTKLDEIIAFAEVEKFADTPVKRYSSGMYVRLAFAVAAHLDPEILIVDEVLAVGDAAFQKKCFGKIGDVARGGRTVLLVSHNMGAVNALCHRCVWIARGGLREDGHPEAVVEAYLSSDLREVAEPLSERTDRIGSGDVRIVGCSLSRSADGPSINELFTGDEVFVKMSLEAKAPTRVFIGVQVKDSQDRMITSFNSREGGFEAALAVGINRINLRIPSFSLLEGRYTLDGACSKVHNASRCDLIQGIHRIAVHARDIFGTGAPFRAYHGVVFVPHVWHGTNGETRRVIPLQAGPACEQVNSASGA